jgi:penicillin V acylase-like amidase (Ntn superfamily)
VRRQWSVVPLLILGLSIPGVACTFFSYTGADLVLFGNSEDHYDENTFLWYVPGSDDEYGCLFLGFSTGFAQGGVNTAGLAFDAAGIDSTPLNDHPELPTPDPMNFCEIVLRHCGTVDEAIALISSYNLSYVTMAQFQFTDATGASVVVAPGPNREIAFVRSEGTYEVTTNTNTAIYPQQHQQCPRHRKVSTALAKIDSGESQLSIATFAAILESVAFTAGPSETMYSNVFDLANDLVYVYYRHDFGRIVVLDLKEMEAAGEAVTHTIQDLVGSK